MHKARSEQGFTLVELLTAMAIGAILLTLAAGAIRQFWFVRTLDGSVDELVTQLRKAQQDSVSEAHPLVFGLRLSPGSTDYKVYRFDPGLTSQTTDDTCSSETRSLSGGLFSAPLSIQASTITNNTSLPEYIKCTVSDPGANVMFFYARGTSNGGSVTIIQPNIGRSATITVTPAVGRVTRT